jgi:aminoglycoside phosphotransferase (APT) family kinase protein
MTEEKAADLDTTCVREGHSFDEMRLADWMGAHINGYRGPLRVSQFKGGQSNPTYKLITPTRTYVLRRKPPGKLLKGAHAIEREAKVLSVLASVNFPVAKIYGLCTDDTVIGTWFYVMEMVEGRVFWDATFPQVSDRDRPRYFDAMNTTLARLHLVDYTAIGLSDYGRPGNYFERQIKRWSTQYVQDTDAGRDPNMDRLIEWLPGNIPHDDGRTVLVHGDFRCDNMIFHPTEPRVMAVLDWELSTLGHPLADFAYHAMMYRMPPHIVAGLVGADVATLNIPTEKDYIAAYCRRTGRDCIAGYDFYVAFGFFRMAAIFHGIKGRVVRGTASSAEARERVRVFAELAEIAWRQTKPGVGLSTPCS